MPVYSRKTLRQALGRSHWIRDTLVGTTTGSWGNTGSATIWDSAKANLLYSGEDLYHRSWAKAAGCELRIATWNTGSGAWMALQTAGSTIASGVEYEIHEMIAPSEKDEALDETIKRVQVRREEPVWSVDQARIYALPAGVIDVLDCYYFASPNGSLTRDRGNFNHWEPVETGSRSEIRIDPPLTVSQQLILDALVIPTLGAADTATVSLPNDRWIIAGAAVDCLSRLAARSPGQEGARYEERRKAAARAYSSLSARFQVQIDRPVQMGQPFERTDLAETEW